METICSGETAETVRHKNPFLPTRLFFAKDYRQYVNCTPIIRGSTWALK